MPAMRHFPNKPNLDRRRHATARPNSHSLNNPPPRSPNSQSRQVQENICPKFNHLPLPRQKNAWNRLVYSIQRDNACSTGPSLGWALTKTSSEGFHVMQVLNIRRYPAGTRGPHSRLAGVQARRFSHVPCFQSLAKPALSWHTGPSVCHTVLHLTSFESVVCKTASNDGKFARVPKCSKLFHPWRLPQKDSK